jgi:hypothetical protein
MSLPRLQLFEFNDAPWAPQALRDTIVEALSRAQQWGRHLEPLVSPFKRFLHAAGVEEVLDLAAGAGGPAALLSDELARAGGPQPRFVLTDLFPHVKEWEALESSRSGRLTHVPEPVDAAALPPALAKGRARLIINALHHFPPPLARQVLQATCQDAPGVFIAEAVVRNPLRFAAMAPLGIPALWLGPLLAKEHRLARAAVAWTPVGMGVSLWDGCISAMRAYSRSELMELLGPAATTFSWEWGEFSFGGVGRGTYCFGVPKPLTEALPKS